MVDTTLDAPEFGADGTDQGFIKWFKALPQVQRRSRLSTISSMLIFRWYCLMNFAMQEPNLVRFFDRKVRQHDNGKHCIADHSLVMQEFNQTVMSMAMSVPLQDYYSVHGENAVFIAKSFYKTTAVVKTMGSSSNNLQGMPFTRMGPLTAADAETWEGELSESADADGSEECVQVLP